MRVEYSCVSLCRLFFVTLLVVAGLCAFASKRLTTTSPEPSHEFGELIVPKLRQYLGLAVLEMAIGDPNRARAYASLVAIPEGLTVYIDTSVAHRARARDLEAWTEEAMDGWNATSSEPRFVRTYQRTDADVVIEFKDRIRGNSGRYAGYVTWRRTVRAAEPGSTVAVSAQVEIANVGPGGRVTQKGEVVKAVGHELGHVLGLDDSDCASHLMGPVQVGAQRLLAVDSPEGRALTDMNGHAQAIMQTSVRKSSRGVPEIFRFAGLR